MAFHWGLPNNAATYFQNKCDCQWLSHGQWALGPALNAEFPVPAWSKLADFVAAPATCRSSCLLGQAVSANLSTIDLTAVQKPQIPVVTVVFWPANAVLAIRVAIVIHSSRHRAAGLTSKTKASEDQKKAAKIRLKTRHWIPPAPIRMAKPDGIVGKIAAVGSRHYPLLVTWWCRFSVSAEVRFVEVNAEKSFF